MSDKHVEFYVANLDCENEASAIERGMRDVPGVESLKVYAKAAKVSLAYDATQVSAQELKEKLALMGFPPQEGRAPAELPKPWRNPKVVTSAISGVLLLAGWLLSTTGLPAAVSTGMYVAAIALGGYYFGREALEELVFEREVGIELLMATAAVAALLMGEAMEAAMLVFLYSISEAAEGYTEEKTRSAVRALMDLAPKKALVRREGREFEIPAEDLVAGDVFIVKPGQALATDGVVIRGASSVNQASVTGESVPVPKHVGDEVFAGTLNEEGALEIRATKAFADNTLARIIHLVEEAQEQKGKSQRFIERFGNRYSPAVLLVGILLALVPPLLFAAPWGTWLERATVFIVAAAPCALVISIPITLVAALGTAARNGVLIKGGVYVEELAKIRVVALDKTGTLTMGEPEVTDVISLGPLSERELLAVAAGVERLSAHPLARAIMRHADAQDVMPRDSTNFQSLTGAGSTAKLDGKPVYAGSPTLFAQDLEVSVAYAESSIRELQDEGKTVVVVGDGTGIWGLLAVRDTLRPNAKAAIAKLREAGISKVAMLTGDNERAARAIAREVGIDEVYAELKPEDKVTRVRELSKTYGHVAMVGDGVNDAPALAEATVGVAMGAAGSDVALETADVALMADDLDKLVYALKLAKRNQAIINQNLSLSAVVIGVLVIGAVAGTFTLPMAVIAHELSEFVVIASGLRMLRA
jgi:Cd2+/Zn2+-exporting ATPase